MIQPRIFLADNHPMVLGALRFLLKDLGEVVGTVTDGCNTPFVNAGLRRVSSRTMTVGH